MITLLFLFFSSLRPPVNSALISSNPSYYKYTCAPLSKLPSCAPGGNECSNFGVG